ncbi:MAG: metallophosphoesterase family protein [Victivallales bacterium]|nr:metallophosphoesterase family protein [Victivallales bacterium]
MGKEVFAILGDIHGNLEAFQTVLAKTRELEVTQYVCIGDIVGYNANPKECLDMLRELKPLGVVRGNHDEYVGNERDLLGFNPAAALAVKWTRDQLTKDDRRWLAELPYEKQIFRFGMAPFSIVHGTLDSPGMWGYIFNRLSAMASMQFQHNDICFCGHTHMPMYFIKDARDTTTCMYQDGEPVKIQPNCKYLFNVGSVGQPRDGDPRAAFAIYRPDEATVELFRLEYDLATTQKKIRDAKLPDRLADRLAIGH